ncbi:MFS transporter [Inquilinus limosus]|uniref:MFS transporter n=1 Tax=Inquilinus limosus TaxID=171674 RepID=UPI0003FE9F49|nr:MFS transporter [Inquilinus limosus]
MAQIEVAAAARTEAPSSVRWKVFAFVAVLTVINLADRTSLSVGMPAIAKELELSPAMQGVLLSAFFWSYALLQIPGGWLIDRMGPSRIIAGSTLLWGVFQTAAMFAVNGFTLLLTRIGLGVSEAPLFPAGGKLNALWLAPQERARGAVIMDSGSYLGAALGGAAIAWLIYALESWRLAFGIAGIVTIALGFAAWRLLRDDPAKHPGVNAAELAHIRAPAPQEAAEKGRTGDAVAARVVAPMMLGRFGWAMMNFGLLTWGPSYLAQARGLDLKAMGAATFVIFGAGFLGALTAGFLADALQKRGLRRGIALKLLLTISGLGTLVGFLLLPHVAEAGTAVALLAATDFLLCFGSLYWSLPAMLAPPGREGTVGGFMNCAGSVGGIVVPIAAGLILQATGAYAAVLTFFAGCAATYVVGTLAIPFARRGAAR